VQAGYGGYLYGVDGRLASSVVDRWFGVGTNAPAPLSLRGAQRPDSRAITSHAYQATTAQEVADAIPDFLAEAEYLRDELRRRLA
jgi:hypothetical protein